MRAPLRFDWPFISVIGALCVLLVSCVRERSAYYNLEHRGERLAKELSELEADTIYCPGAMSSLSGQWLLCDSGLVFLDHFSVGIKHYSLDGRFICEKIKEGRGPGEVTGTSWASAWDNERKHLVVNDKNLFIQVFDDRDSLLSYQRETWIMLMDEKVDTSKWKDRLLSPDLLDPQVYDYNFECERVYSFDGVFYVPVIIEHPKLNGYDKSATSKRYWKDARVLLSFVPGSIAETKKLLGRYPPVYHSKNIPVFATYDFFVQNDRIHVSFAADPNIYVLDLDGNPLYSYGVGEDRISLSFPQTRSFEEYEYTFKSQRETHGHYCRLASAGGHVFRTCFTDEGKWILQVYDGDYLVSTFDCHDDIKIIGASDGWIYADAGADFRNEYFRIIRFRI